MTLCILRFVISFLSCFVHIRLDLAKREEHRIAINHVRCLPTVIPVWVFELVLVIGWMLFASIFLLSTGRLMRKLDLNGGSISIHSGEEQEQNKITTLAHSVVQDLLCFYNLSLHKRWPNAEYFLNCAWLSFKFEISQYCISIYYHAQIIEYFHMAHSLQSVTVTHKIVIKPGVAHR